MTESGWDLIICSCAGGPYVGARKAGTPDCCERCGFMTAGQHEHIKAAARAEGARDMRTKIEALLMATANHHERVFQHPGGSTRTCGVCSLPWPCQTYTARRALLADGGEPQ